MKRWLLLVLGLLSFWGGACATTNEDVYPDEGQIRDNAGDAHKRLEREEKKNK